MQNLDDTPNNIKININLQFQKNNYFPGRKIINNAIDLQTADASSFSINPFIS